MPAPDVPATAVVVDVVVVVLNVGVLFPAGDEEGRADDGWEEEGDDDEEMDVDVGG